MRKIRTKFLVYILLPVLVILTGSGVVSYLLARQIVVQQLWNLGQSELAQAVDEVDSTFGTGVQTLRILALHEGVMGHDLEHLGRVFVKLQEKLPVEEIFLLLMDGRIVSGAGPAVRRVENDILLEPWVAAAMDSEEPIISAPMDSRLTGARVVIIASRITNQDGACDGVVAYTVPLSMMKTYMPTPGNGPLLDSVFSIFLRDGTFIAHTDPTKLGCKLGESSEELHVRMRESLSTERRDFHGIGYVDGVKYYAGYRRSRYGELYMAIAIPAASALYPVHELLFSYVLIGSCALVSLTFLLLTLSHRIGRPLNMLAEAADSFGRGNTDILVPVISNDELGRLTYAFNKMITGIRQRDMIRDTFGRYVSPQVVDEVLESKDGLKLGGEKRVISILMSDLRAFSARTAHMTPEAVLTFLNRYLGAMVHILLRHHAVIDEIQGDGILALFGAPIPVEEHAARAVECAVEMQSAMDEVNEQNQREGFPVIEMAVAVNTGEVVVGNIGSELRTKYGAVGAAVNFAGRIQSYAWGGQVLLGESTYRLVEDIVDVRSKLRVEMKGFPGPVVLYDVIGIRGTTPKFLRERNDLPNPLVRPMSVLVRTISGKSVSHASFPARITHISEATALIDLPSPLSQSLEIRMEPLEEIQGAEAFAKIMFIEPAGDRYSAQLSFSFISDVFRDAVGKRSM